MLFDLFVGMFFTREFSTLFWGLFLVGIFQIWMMHTGAKLDNFMKSSLESDMELRELYENEILEMIENNSGNKISNRKLKNIVRNLRLLNYSKENSVKALSKVEVDDERVEEIFDELEKESMH